MIISEWPAMIMVTAERVAPGDVMYGKRKSFMVELFDEPWHVVASSPSIKGRFHVRIDGHASNGPQSKTLDIHDHVLIAKKGK